MSGFYMITEDVESCQLIHSGMFQENKWLVEGQTILKVLDTEDYDEALVEYQKYLDYYDNTKTEKINITPSNGKDKT